MMGYRNDPSHILMLSTVSHFLAGSVAGASPRRNYSLWNWCVILDPAPKKCGMNEAMMRHAWLLSPIHSRNTYVLHFSTVNDPRKEKRCQFLISGRRDVFSFDVGLFADTDLSFVYVAVVPMSGMAAAKIGTRAIEYHVIR